MCRQYLTSKHTTALNFYGGLPLVALRLSLVMLDIPCATKYIQNTHRVQKPLYKYHGARFVACYSSRVRQCMSLE